MESQLSNWQICGHLKMANVAMSGVLKRLLAAEQGLLLTIAIKQARYGVCSV